MEKTTQNLGEEMEADCFPCPPDNADVPAGRGLDYYQQVLKIKDDQALMTYLHTMAAMGVAFNQHDINLKAALLGDKEALRRLTEKNEHMSGQTELQNGQLAYAQASQNSQLQYAQASARLTFEQALQFSYLDRFNQLGAWQSAWMGRVVEALSMISYASLNAQMVKLAELDAVKQNNAQAWSTWAQLLNTIYHVNPGAAASASATAPGVKTG
jgi:hypothetical protein